MKKVTSGGGRPAIRYAMRKARASGGIWKMWKALRGKNAGKTCALGMGGQRGGTVNERGGFSEVCKKSLQAMAADMQGAIKSDFWKTYSIEQLKKGSRRAIWSRADVWSNRCCTSAAGNTIARSVGTRRSTGLSPG